MLVIADDMGVEQVGAYGAWRVGPDPPPPPTPHLDALARQGLRFRHVWSNPLCSPSRALLLTGRHGFRTGIGGIFAPRSSHALAVDRSRGRTLPQALAARAQGAYAAAAVGKWHLAPGDEPDHPQRAGFSRYAGTLLNISVNRRQDYGGSPDARGWEKTTWPPPARDDPARCRVAGTPTVTCRAYATRDTAREALEALRELPEPFLLWVAFNAPHRPFHLPPRDLYPELRTREDLSDPPTVPELYRTMVEAMDQEIGRIVAALADRGIEGRTTVIFVGDNGTPFPAADHAHFGVHAKGTLFEPGIRVPLIVWSARRVARGLRGAVVERALVSLADVYATVAELAGVDPSPGLDARSLVPCLRDPRCPGRDTLYAERFRPSGLPGEGGRPREVYEQALRDRRGYKLVWENGAERALHRLPDEARNLLCGPLDPEARGAREGLRRSLEALAVPLHLDPAALPPGPRCPQRARSAGAERPLRPGRPRAPAG